MSSVLQKPGTLWVVATPLGNPGDLSPRAAEVLSAADTILAEDTRRSGLLLKNCGIAHNRFMSLHDHNEEGRIPQVLEAMEQGQNFALVSDAGTPLLSDPGYRLVRACRERGLKVTPLPGPSASLTALCASGIAPQPFIFLGFPPRKEGDIRTFFRPYAELEVTIIFFERKDRVKSTLQLLHELLGQREGCIARELTKTYEEFINFKLDSLNTIPDELQGEMTIIIGPPLQRIRSSEAELAKAYETICDTQKDSAKKLKPRELARMLKEQTKGWSVDEIYDFIKTLRG